MTDENREAGALIPCESIPDSERIALLERILADEELALEGSRIAHWSTVLACVADACARLDYSWELSYDSGKRIEGKYLSDPDGGEMLSHDEVERRVREGKIPVMVDPGEKGFHVMLAQWGRQESLSIRGAVDWLVQVLLLVAREELEELKGATETATG